MSCCSGLTCADSLAVFVMWASEYLRTSFICLISVSRSPSVPNEWVGVRVNAGAHTDVADMSRLKGWYADYMNGAAHAQWWGIDSFTHLNKYKIYPFQVGIISLRKGGKVSAWVKPRKSKLSYVYPIEIKLYFMLHISALFYWTMLVWSSIAICKKKFAVFTS